MARSSRRTVLAAVVGVVVCAVVAAAGWAAEPVPTAGATLHLGFGRVVGYADGHCGNPVLTSGRYALVSFRRQPSQACASGFLLVDDRSGKRTVIRASGFQYVLAFGAPWILFFHSSQFELYNIQTHKSRQLGCDIGCMPGGTFGYALGSRWLEFTVQQSGSCGDGIHYDCGPITHSFYNVVTRVSRPGLRMNSRSVVDLDSPTLVRKVCSPLRVPDGGSLTLYGAFAVATRASGSFLQRCGSHSRIAVGEPGETIAGAGLLATSHAVLWKLDDAQGAFSGQLAGVLLPSLRRVTITLPPKVRRAGGAATIALDAYRLYVEDSSGTLLSASLPPI